MTATRHRVALLVGGGIGAELIPDVLEVLAGAGADFDWQRIDVPISMAGDDSVLNDAVEAVRECGVGYKTKLLAPRVTHTRVTDTRGSGSESSDAAPSETARSEVVRSDLARPLNPNVELRQRLGLFAGVRPIRSLPGLATRYPDLDILIIRENTEDIYKGIEHEIVPGVVESLKVVTREACDRIAKYAFRIAKEHERKHLTFIHKGNIMKRSDGLFMNTVRGIAERNPEVGYKEMIVDAACMRMVLNPSQFDMMLMGNLYGDILSSLGSGLAGGISVGYSINLGDDCRVFEAIHGDADHLVGTGSANPLPLLMPGMALMRHFGDDEGSDRLESAISQVLTSKEALTPDLGGQAGTRQMCEAILAAMEVR